VEAAAGSWSCTVVDLDGGHRYPGLGQGQGQGPDAGSYLQHSIARTYGRQFDDPTHRVGFDDEVLA